MKLNSLRKPGFLFSFSLFAFLSTVMLFWGTGCKNPTREQNKRINPQIFPAFRMIEIHAYEYVMREEVNRKEYERCKELIEDMNEDARKSNRYENYSVSALEYYLRLQFLGFELPPLYLDKAPAIEEIRAAEKLQSDLMSKLMEIMVRHSKFRSDEFQERIKLFDLMRSRSATPSETIK